MCLSKIFKKIIKEYKAFFTQHYLRYKYKIFSSYFFEIAFGNHYKLKKNSKLHMLFINTSYLN